MYFQIGQTLSHIPLRGSCHGNQVHTGKIGFLQEGKYRHRHSTPPERIAQEYGLIAVGIGNLCGNRWQSVVNRFFPGSLHGLFKIHRERNLTANFHYAASGLAGNGFCHMPHNIGIRIIHDKHIRIFRCFFTGRLRLRISQTACRKHCR